MARVMFDDAGYGYDVFGMSPRWVARTLWPTKLFYRHYFRVQSHGAENIPASGAAILAANHSGPVPIDAVMLYTDVVTHTEPTRIPRPIMDLFVTRLPIVGNLFSRVGGVNGTRRNVRRLLERGELLMIFPEGTPGVAKTAWHRYELQPWRVGHVELAIRYRVPVVPVAIIGAEEMWPLIARSDRVKLFGAPYLPVPATPLPMPVRFHIHYGEPIVLHEDYEPRQSDDPDVLSAAAERIATAVRGLIEGGLAEREGVFR